MRLLCLSLGLAASAAAADPAPPAFAAPITALQFGVFCDRNEGRRIEAPDTELGYIEAAPDRIDLGPPRQQLAADLGLAFGIAAHSRVTLDGVLLRITRPGRDRPDEWTFTLDANAPSYSYFAFEHAFEQVPGLYRIEGIWQDRLIFSAEFDVLPPGSMPGLLAECRGDLISGDIIIQKSAS